MDTQLIAKCGHWDGLGYFAGTVCGKCARTNHRRALKGLPPLALPEKGGK